MSSFEKYSEFYDLLYKDKNYETECDFIEKIFKKYSLTHVRTILDAGCGSGGHAIPLAKRGYNVTGFDLSKIMLELAKKKAREKNIENIELHVSNLSSFKFAAKYDACISMFAVMGYITKTRDLLQSLTNLRRHMKDGSLFIFDFWNGLAVLRTLPSERIKIMEEDRRKVIRIAQPELDAYHHICKVKYKIIIIEDNSIIDEIEEIHVVRFYFPQEIIHYLEETGFEVLDICSFMDLDGRVNENVWNISVIAKAVGNV